MNRKRFLYVAGALGLVAVGSVGWTLTARAAYESAEYKVIESDGAFEVREYPDLMLASTTMKSRSQGSDGSFMRLFRYISGSNEQKQKVAMTTPVFMEESQGGEDGQMGFVIPKQVTAEGIPAPQANSVTIRKRTGGRFAVVRFAGRMDSKSVEKHEAQLREWLNARGLECDETAEYAGYDPPFTPPPLRRNEVLIRLK